MQNYILGYGSLMNAESMERALKRKIRFEDFLPVKLIGYKRMWSVKENVFSEHLNKKINAVFLDIQPSSENYLNAVIFAVSVDDLKLLTKREKNYNLIEVTETTKIEGNRLNNESNKVFTFASKQNSRVKDGEENIYVLKKYVEMVEAACLRINKKFRDEFLATTQKNSFELIDGKYSFTDSEQKKYV